MAKILVTKTSELLPGKMQKITTEGKDIIVANIDGDYFAMDDTCTHSGASLAEGKLENNVVTCGWHAAEFDCKTGKLEKFPAKIRDLETYNVIVESDDVFVEV